MVTQPIFYGARERARRLERIRTGGRGVAALRTITTTSAAIVLFVSATAFAEQAKPAPPALPTPIAPIVLDVSSAGTAQLSPKTAMERRQLRADLEQAIAADPGLEASGDVELTAALYGDTVAIAVERGVKAAEAAVVAAENDRCSDSIVSAQIAVVELAAAQTLAQTKRLEITETKLRDAYRARFICSLKGSNPTETLRWASSLRAVGQKTAPQGVSEEAWAKNPELDASTNINHARLSVQSQSPGARVFVDHQYRGVTPLTIHVRQGDHVVAIGNRGGAIATTISISGWTHTEVLDERTPRGRWGSVAVLVGSLQAKTRAADAAAISEVMTLSGAQAAFVIVGGGTVELWRKDAQGKATRIGQRHDPKQVVALLSKQSPRGSTFAKDPSRPLLREDPRENKDTEERATKWWVYAAVLGAAAVGAGIIIAGQSGQDRQRIEISLP